MGNRFPSLKQNKLLKKISLNGHDQSNNNDNVVNDKKTQISTQDNNNNNNSNNQNTIDNDNKNNTHNTNNTNINNNNNDTKTNDNDTKINNNNVSQPQYKYTWQWLENDGTWHDYDATTQLLLDQLSIGQKITISAGKWIYQITKLSNMSCTQLNTQTNKQRNSRRAKILIVANNNINNTNNNINNNCIGSNRYIFIWQFLENNNKWQDLSFNIASKLENLALNGIVKYSISKWSYTVTKISMDECIQTNDNTSNGRDLRRILYDKNNGKRIVWQFMNDNVWCTIDSNDLMLNLLKLPIGQTIQNYTRGQWNYNITKTNHTNATQTNTNTNKIRYYKMIEINKDNMDINWLSKIQTTNQKKKNNYQKKKKKSNRVHNYNNNKNELKERIKIDPNDIQDIIINENENENEYKSDTILMSDDDKILVSEFRKTLTDNVVEIISIQKIKENVSKKMVYSALLSHKKDELKNKVGIDINKIERVLFHGTSFRNIPKIVNNGFNRDFNRNHLYGKGTYFSSVASQSAKYCENDHENDNRKYVMLVCKVIIGEYCIGTRDMDGCSTPYKPDKKAQYESCVNSLHKPTIFVINRDYHAIPTHIITFKYTNKK